MRIETTLPEAATKRLVDIVHEPSSFPEDAKPFRATGRKQIWWVTVEGRELFVKLWLPREGLGALKEVLRESAGLDVWRTAREVTAAGVDTPRPIAAGEKRKVARLLDWSFYACERVTDAVPLAGPAAEAPAWPAPKAQSFARALGVAFARLLGTGFHQPDFKPTNFLVRGRLDGALVGELSLVAIDLRRCRIVEPKRAMSDPKTLAQLRTRVLAGWPDPLRKSFEEAFAWSGLAHPAAKRAI